MLSVHIVRIPILKKIIAVCLASLFIFCCSDQIKKLPDYWEYSPGKWVAFKDNIEIGWDYDDPKIDKFKIEKFIMKLNNDDMKEIKKLIRKKNIDGLVAMENSLLRRLKFEDKTKYYQTANIKNYKDIEKPIPTFGEMCFYQVSAVKDYSTSPSESISVIFIDRSK